MESNELLKTLYKRINELSNNNVINNSITKDSNNEKIEKIKKDNNKSNNIKDKEESNKAFNSLVDKLINKFDFEKQEDLKIENDLVNTKLYKNLIKKFTINNEIDNEPELDNNINKNTGFNNAYQDNKINRVIFFLNKFLFLS